MTLRPMNRVLWIALMMVASWAASPLYAAGAYSQNFSAPPSGWTSATTFSVTNGYYRNEDDQLANAIAVYNGDTWNTNYTYNIRLYSQYGSPTAPGNQLGIVFNYVDANNYYRLLINTIGEVLLERVTSGTAQPVPGGYATVTDMVSDIWFDAQLALVGNKATVRVKVGSTWQTAFSNVTVAGLTTAKIGVVSRFNLARFDDIVITPSANLLFKTGFDGATIQAPRDCYGPPGGCWQDITGTDPVTGFSWPANVWTMTGRFQTITVHHPVTPQTLPNYILNEIRTVTGPHGNQTPVLYQGILQPRPTGASYYMQDPYIITLGTDNNAPQGDIYIRYWVKLQSTPGTNGLGSWRNLLQWKTGGDFRLNLEPATFSQMGTPTCPTSGRFWRLLADNNANSTDPDWELENYWEVCDTTGRPIPTGEWMKLEMFWSRGTPGGTNGRVWVAINGQQLFNEVGRRMWGNENKRINRIMAPQLYTSAVASPSAPVEQFTDDYEIWDGFPADASPH